MLKKIMRVGGGGLGEDCKWVSDPWPPPPNTAPKILIVAGEASGDSHAARLVAAIKENLPQAEFFGIGGEALKAQGVRVLYPASELAVVGLWEVAARLPAVWRALKAIRLALKTARPSLAILVDFPDFNFWVARLARCFRVPVMYYISPQVWAWRTYRVRLIARLVDRMVVIFPFEEEFYRKRGVPVEYVGHPLRETLPPLPERRVLLEKRGLDPERLTVALLPGSRAGEIRAHLPLMLAGAEILQKSLPECQFILPCASTAPVELIHSLVANFPGTLGLVAGQSYPALAAAHLAVVASGTATVEAALAGTPTIIVYRVSPLSYEVGRRLIRVEHVGMANLLAEERLFPELIQDDFTPENLAREMLALVKDAGRLKKMRRGLARIVTSLGGPGASRRAARAALELVGLRV
ncbi:MAG: lipid-A-disaccharide synthase [Desulfobaccales bacterium]|nr:lipid-A-disaccharide synthase [Desulfobaccales bacterium]